MTRSAPLARALDGLGLLLIAGAALGSLAALHGLSSATDAATVYDEGLLLSGARALSRGAVPYRDFYANYPPGAFALLAAAWALAGTSVATLHALAAALQWAVALLCGRLAGLASGGRFRPLGAGLVLLALGPLGSASLAWVAALGAALVLALRVASGARGPRAAALAGLAAGAIGVFRHDLFVYACAAAAAALWFGRDRVRLEAAEARALAAGALAVLLPVWVPVLALAGPWQVVNDLVVEQIVHVEPARALPLPPIVAPVAAPPLPFPLPGALAGAGGAAFALALAGPALALAAGVRRGLPAAGWTLAIVGVALVPHMLGRSDDVHCVLSAPPSLALAAAALDRAARGAVRSRLLAALATAAVLFPWRGQWPGFERPPAPPAFHLRTAGAPPSPARDAAVAAVHALCPAGGRVFVGNVQHRRLIFNDAGFHYHADRDAATRRTQFDPGVVTRADVQAQMVAELERARPCAAVLFAAPWWPEPNLSAREGAGTLDAHIAARYELVARAAPWFVLRPRQDPEG